MAPHAAVATNTIVRLAVHYHVPPLCLPTSIAQVICLVNLVNVVIKFSDIVSAFSYLFLYL